MDERERLTAYGTQLILTHARLRDMIEDLRDGRNDGRNDGQEPGGTIDCLAFCDAVTEHHTDEDVNVFPLLSERHPELRDFLSELRRDHVIIAGLVEELRRQTTAETIDAIAAVLETHFRGEEKRLTGVLNAIAG